MAEIHKGRYNMDFDSSKGDPYGNIQKAREHMESLKKNEAAPEGKNSFSKSQYSIKSRNDVQ